MLPYAENRRVVQMKKTNKLTSAEREVLRAFLKERGRTGKEVQRAQVLLALEDQQSFLVISSLTGFDRKYAFRLRRKYRERGVEVLKTKKRKSRSFLTKNQLKEIEVFLHETTPLDHGYEDDFWSTLVLGDLIEKKYNVKYKSRTPLQLIFKKFKLTFHKPGGKYAKRDNEKISTWKKEIKQKLKEFDFEKDAVLLTEDEMILTTQTTFQKIWLPAGCFPKIDVSSSRKRRCIYGFFNPINGSEHAFKAMAGNSEETCKVLNKIGRLYKNKTIVIIWDNASWHKSKEVKTFLKKTKHKFHLINFPPYAPEENPQEHAWKAGRTNITHNKFIENIDKITDQFVAFLNNAKFDYKFLNFN